jgi:membrane dipeptidase
VIGWKDASEALDVTVELLRRGYHEDEIAKLWGGNFLRVFRQVEAVSGQLRPVLTSP